MTQRRVIAIATNANPELRGKRTGLWLSELTHFLDVMASAGFECDVASPAGGRIPLDERSATKKEKRDAANARFWTDGKFRASLQDSPACAAIEGYRYDALYLAGGHGTMWDFCQSSELAALITSMYAAGKTITGVCHGISGLLGAHDTAGRPLVERRHVTGFSNFEDTLAGVKKQLPFLLEDALKQHGAVYKKALLPFTSHLEVDERLITGQNPASARSVGERLVRTLC